MGIAFDPWMRAQPNPATPAGVRVTVFDSSRAEINFGVLNAVMYLLSRKGNSLEKLWALPLVF